MLAKEDCKIRDHTPSAPASIRPDHSSSLSLNICTTPRFAHAARMYSESHDQPAWDIHKSEEVATEFGEFDFDLDVVVVETRSCVWVGDGDASSSQVRVIWKVSTRRIMSLSCTAVRMK